MSTATLLRRTPITVGNCHAPDMAFEEEVLFEGEIRDAVAAAQALPADDKRWLSLVSDAGTFRPEEFDRLVSQAAFVDIDLTHGSMFIRVTAAALLHLRGPLPLPIPAMDVIEHNLDALNAVVRRKQKAGETIRENERRIVVIDVADLD